MTTSTDAARGGTEATAGAFAPTVPPRRWRTIKRFPNNVPKSAAAFSMSRGRGFELLALGLGPEVLQIGGRRLITYDAAREWAERVKANPITPEVLDAARAAKRGERG